MSPYERLQLDFDGTMNGEPYFDDIGIFVLRPRLQADGTVQTVPDIQGKIEGALAGYAAKAGKAGVAVTIMMPTIEVDLPNVPGPQESIVVSLLVEEVPFINMGADGTLKSAESICLELRQLFHHRIFYPCTTLVCDKNATTPIAEPESGKLTYEMRFRCKVGNAKPAKVATPAIASTGPVGADYTVTLTCATSGAAIYYSTSGILPVEGALGATLYSAPFTAIAGATIRAAAFKAAFHGSDVNSATI